MVDNLIVKHYGGSHAYGTNIETSDVDVRGVFCGSELNIRTPFYTVREVVQEDADDEKYYELSHYMKLCLGCNPNILETIWVDETDIISSTPAYNIMRERRFYFLSSKIAFTTSGYAISQLKRIRGHNKWINNPQPVDAPKQKDFIKLIYNLTEDKVLKFDISKYNSNHRLLPFGSNMYGIYESEGYSLYDKFGKLNVVYDEAERIYSKDVEFIVQFNREEYKRQCGIHNNYWTWKNNRNEARAELEEKYTYDTKHAMYLVRLFRMGLEALQTGVINIKRPDAAELLDIRNGSMSYDELIEYVEYMDNEIKTWYKLTYLRKTPDIKLAAKTIIDIQDSIWYGKENK